MSDKKIDGIKKIDKKDVEKFRRIVLESVNKQVKDLMPENDAKPLSINKKIDGIFGNIKKSSVSTNSKAKEVGAKSKPPLLSLDKKVEPKSKPPLSPLKKKSFSDSMANYKDVSQFGLTPALAAIMSKKQNNSAKQKNKINNKNIKKQIADDFITKNKAQKAEKDIKAQQKKKEKKNLKKTILQEKIRKKVVAEKEHERRRKEKRAKRQADRIKFNKNIKIRFKKFIVKLKKGFKQSLVFIGVGIVLGILFYSLLALLILKLNFDNTFFRTINKYIPVPAYITSAGIVDYYSYIDIKSQIARTENSAKNVAELTKIRIVEELIYEKLINIYNLKNIKNSDLRAELEKKVAFDNKINQVGINRIKKIKEMINAGNNFVKIAGKYGDMQGLLNINNTNREQISYANEVSRLAVGEISDIVYADDGYYIFRCYDITGDNIALSYVYVKGKTLDKYMNEKIKNYKLWSLVD